ncbi:hypothetical protein D7X98_04945 [bacterium 1XD8-76]|nr:hypothetical protein D7X98_04945 [bacterium 1XD8-76]
MKPDYTSVVTRSMQKLGSNGGTDMTNLTKTMLGGGGDNTLIDYTAIKNGSYGKLLKAYYSEVPEADTKKALKEEVKNKKVELVQDALEGKSSKSSTDTTYNAMADKIKNLSDSVSTLFNESV